MLNTKFEKDLREHLETYTSEEILELVSAINSYSGELEDLIWNYWDDEFFNLYFSDSEEAARATFFGNIQSWSDTYIRFNAYGNLESTSYISYSEYDVDEIIDSLDRLPPQYLPDDIAEFIEIWELTYDCYHDEEEEEEE